jgi:hypothetical protein
MKATMQLLVTILILSPMVAGCVSSNRPSTVVNLEKEEYPVTIGEDYDAFLVATFVKKRTEFARQLWEKERLEDCIIVLEELLKHIPASVRNRYDLGTMYYQRAFPLIKKHRRLSMKLSNLSADNEKQKAEDLQKELAGVYLALREDCKKAFDQFSAYSRSMPQDPRPVDMMWRCQMALEKYVDASDTIERMIRWEGVLDDKSQEDYRTIQRTLRRYILETGQRNRRGLGNPNKIAPPR